MHGYHMLLHLAVIPESLRTNAALKVVLIRVATQMFFQPVWIRRPLATELALVWEVSTVAV